MKHCQITGVEMPDKVDLRDKCGPVQDQGGFGSATSIALVSMVDSSAEFPEAEFRTWFTEKYDEVDYTDCAIWGHAVGFERGRAINDLSLAAACQSYARQVNGLSEMLTDLEAKLAEAQAYSKGLEETILKLTKAFDKAKNGKVICEDCGSALFRS